MTKAEQRAESERLLRQARYGKRRVRTTRCPLGLVRGGGDLTAKRGGTLPGHLDARFLPDHPDDVELQRAILQEHC